MHRLRIVIAALFSVVTMALQAQTSDTVAVDTMPRPWDVVLREKLGQLASDPALSTSHVSMCVYDITADSLLFEHDSQKLMRPASTMKLLTSITALSKFGGAYTFDTNLYRTGQVSDSILHGDVYVVGNFDPKFSTDDLHSMVEAIKRLGISRVEGGIYADMSMKDSLPLGEGWCWDDKNPQLIPLQLNQRNVVIKELVRHLDAEGIKADTSGIALCPVNEAELMVRRFHTIDQILLRMMKNSDNLYAEAMFYQLPRAGKHGLYASARDAASVIGTIIRHLGYTPSDYTIADGSGLSIYNQLTAELEVAFLRYAYSDANIFNHLYPSLPIAGQDGTLSSRMTRGEASGNVHAKTGTLRSVSTLAGYATASNGHFIAFSLMNQGIGRQATGRNWQDRVCQAICE